MARQDASSGNQGQQEQEALLNDDTRVIVQKMVDQGIYLITPTVDAKGISYPALSNVFPDKSNAEITELLERLTGSGILKSKLLDKIIVCPTCSSPSVYSKYNCPRCSSFDIGKASIIEHIRCGYIGSKEKFQKGNILVCPKCKNTVSEVDYRKIGTSFECNACGSRFEAPRMSHKCNACDDVFTYKEARYEPIYEFELSEDTKKSVAKGTLPLASIVTTLKDAGYDVGLKRDLLGKSGATHNFDIVAKRDSVLVVANFTFEPKEEDIIGLFAKKYDVDPTFTLLIALTPPSKEEEAVSKAYGVMILSASPGSQTIGDQIISLVDTHLSETRAAMRDKEEEARKEEEERAVLQTVDRETPSADLGRPVTTEEKEAPPEEKKAETLSAAMEEKSAAPVLVPKEYRSESKEKGEVEEEEEEVESGDEESEKQSEESEAERERERQKRRPKGGFSFEDEEWEQYDF